MLSSQEIVARWQIQVETLNWLPEMPFDDASAIVHCAPQVRPVVGNRLWLPIAGDADGCITIYIDFDPAPSGSVGQIIQVYPEATEWHLLAKDLSEFWDIVAHFVMTSCQEEDAGVMNAFPMD